MYLLVKDKLCRVCPPRKFGGFVSDWFPFCCKPNIASKFNFGVDSSWQNFRNLTLSYRGSERQAPNTLQLSLRFSKVMELRASDGSHGPNMSTEERLRDVVNSFNQTAGLQAKHRMDEDRYKACYNIIAGSCEVVWLT